MTSPATRNPERHQYAVVDLIDGFTAHDTAGLAALTPQQRASQAAARGELAAYVDDMWTEFKRRGLHPADHPEQYNAVAALRDLTHHLHLVADSACT